MIMISADRCIFPKLQSLSRNDTEDERYMPNKATFDR